MHILINNLNKWRDKYMKKRLDEIQVQTEINQIELDIASLKQGIGRMERLLLRLKSLKAEIEIRSNELMIIKKQNKFAEEEASLLLK